MSNPDAESFDPYHRWLGISPKDQPPNHYRLLGVDLFEDDPDVISSSADRQMLHLRTFQAGQRRDLSQQILNELAQAKVCLLNPDKKAEYDRQLRSRLSASGAVSKEQVSNEAPSRASASNAAVTSASPLGAELDVGLDPLASTPLVRAKPLPLNLTRSRRKSSPIPLLACLGVATVFVVFAAGALVYRLRGGKTVDSIATRDPSSDSDPIRSRPPVAPPSVAQPPVGQPPASQPPVAQPSVAQPPVAQPSASQPSVAQPSANPSLGSQPPVTPTPAKPLGNPEPAPTTSTSELADSGTVDFGPGPYALQFTGKSFVEFTNTKSLASWNRTFTAEMWVRWADDGTPQCLMGTLVRPPAVRAYGGWSLGVASSLDKHTVFPTVHLGGGIMNFKLTPRDWHHVALVHDDENWENTYVDGRRVARGNTKYDDRELSNLFLGAIKTGGPKVQSNIDIRAFRLSSGARYDRDFELTNPHDFAKDNDTILLLDFSKPNSQTIEDISGNGRHGTISGATWVSINETASN